MDLVLLARYPFLPEAAAYIENDGPALDELLGERVYATARSRGRERVLRAIEDASVDAPELSDASPARDLLEELLSYVYARILVSALADPYVVRRHALAEAVRMRELLMRERLGDGRSLAASATAVGLGFESDGDAFRAHFTEFLRYAVYIKDLPWKLVRQPMKDGIVRMDAERASRLVQEALRRRIESELPKMLSDELVRAVEPDLAPLREAARIRKEAYQAEGFGKVDLAVIPPCMHHILGQLQKGENAPHHARFAIVTFLNKIGMTSEEILRLFAQAPDFREDLTRYQVEHITGVTSGTTYSVPGCDNLQTFNLCYADDLCRTRTKADKARVIFPTDYYKLMHEAGDRVAALSARVPLVDPLPLTKAAARNYALLKRIEAITTSPDFERLDGQLLAGLCLARKAPIKIEGERGSWKFVVDPAEPWDIPDLLAAEWVGEAILDAAPAVDQSSPSAAR